MTNNYQFRYLRQVGGEGIYHLSNKVRPETRAMLAAMVSRVPRGGINQRYYELLKAVSEDEGVSLDVAERLLTNTVPRKVQEFMDINVGKYGHASVLELTGDPCIFVEGVSWVSAYLSFDGPLVKGQEFSTRARSFKNWPMCREVYDALEDDPDTLGRIYDLHNGWLGLFESELAFWEDMLKDPEVRERMGIGDDEPFRPALDQARWALPGTIATGFVHTSNVRDQGRLIDQAQSVIRNESNGRVSKLWADIRAAYKEALPGFKNYYSREATYENESEPHAEPHLQLWSTRELLTDMQPTAVPQIPVAGEWIQGTSLPGKYASAALENYSVFWGVPSVSLAVIRDLHRHRPAWPMTIRVPSIQYMYEEEDEGRWFGIDFSNVSQGNREKLRGLVRKTKALGVELREKKKELFLMLLLLPLGARGAISARSGYRSFKYMIELRENARGGDIAYRKIARQLRQAFGRRIQNLEQFKIPIANPDSFKIPK